MVRGAGVSRVIICPVSLRLSIITAFCSVNESRIRRLSFWIGSISTISFWRNLSTTPSIVAKSWKSIVPIGSVSTSLIDKGAT